jgi:hypothetical protein
MHTLESHSFKALIFKYNFSSLGPVVTASISDLIIKLMPLPRSHLRYLYATDATSPVSPSINGFGSGNTYLSSF